jgi:hypothetical protein
MSAPINSNTAFNQDVRSLKNAQEKDNASIGPKESGIALEKKMAEVKEPIAVTQKKQLNAAIIESSLKFSNTIGDKPLSLLLKTALQGINEALKAGDVDNTIEDAYESGIDFSAEATAERIVSFSTQFFGAYKEQHPEMSEEESLTAFVDVIRGGIDQGFGEAKDILDGLQVLTGDVATTVDKTYQLVQEGLKSFVDSFSKEEQAPEE